MKESDAVAVLRPQRGQVAHAGVAAGQPAHPSDPVSIRPIRPTDPEGLEAFYLALSDESRRTRFLGVNPGIGHRTSAYFCHPDHAHREGFVAVVRPTGEAERIVGHVCVEPDGPSCAEVAVAVADEFQGHGVGRSLVEAAVTWARRDGYDTLVATMLAGNPAIQRLLTGLDLPARTSAIGAGTIEIRIDLGIGGRAAA